KVNAPIPFRGIQRDIELRRGIEKRDPTHFAIAQAQHAFGDISYIEQYLEQRIAIKITVWVDGLDDLFKGKILMRITAEADFPHATKCLYCRSRMIHGQIERRQRRFQPSLPVRELGFHGACLEPLSLPGSIVAELNWQRRQWRILLFQESAVQITQLAKEDIHG